MLDQLRLFDDVQLLPPANETLERLLTQWSVRDDGSIVRTLDASLAVRLQEIEHAIRRA
jgi:hypothetical protein